MSQQRIKHHIYNRGNTRLTESMRENDAVGRLAAEMPLASQRAGAQFF